MIISLAIPTYFLFVHAGFNKLWSSLMFIPMLLEFLFSGSHILPMLIVPKLVVFLVHILITILAIRSWPQLGEVKNPIFFYDYRNAMLVLIYFFIPPIPIFVTLRKLGFGRMSSAVGIFPPIFYVLIWYRAIKVKFYT